MTFKKINKFETNFYILEISSTKFSIYDSEFDEPIYHGGWNMVEGIIKNIKKHSKDVQISYYIKEKSGLLKYNPQWSYNPK